MCSVVLAVAFDCFPRWCWHSNPYDNSRTVCPDAMSYLENHLWHLNQVRGVDVLLGVCLGLSVQYEHGLDARSLMGWCRLVGHM